MTWKLFRAPDLAFWTLAVIVLTALAVVAANLGGYPERAASAPGSAAVASATTSDSSVQAREILALMPAGTAAGTDPVALSTWAQSVRERALQGAAVREAEGAEQSDDLRTEFGQIATYASQLEAVAGDPVAATATRTQIGLRASRVVALVQGMPAPALPAGSTDLFGQTGARPDQPVSGNPATPPLPSTPGTTTSPTLKEIP